MRKRNSYKILSPNISPICSMTWMKWRIKKADGYSTGLCHQFLLRHESGRPRPIDKPNHTTLSLIGIFHHRIILHDIRHIRRPPMNALHLGSRHKPIKFRKTLIPLFHRQIYDPAPYLGEGFDRANLCVPACLLLGLHYKLGPSLRALNISKIKKELKTIQYESFIEITGLGMPLKNISAFEKTLSPIPNALLELFPQLRCFKGIALNLFSIRRNGEVYRLFPMSLSKHSRELRTHFQLDLLIDTSDIRDSQHAAIPENHVLLIAHLPRLLCRFSDKKNNVYKFPHCCRGCCRVFMNLESVEAHQNICDHRQRGVTGRRKTRNVLVHTVWKRNKFTGSLERNGLQFRKWDNFRLLKPSAFVTLDFEAINRKADSKSQSIFHKTPNSAIYTQKITSYCYVNKSLYDQYPLSREMATPRFAFLDETASNPERDFYLKLLFSLRNELLVYDDHIHNILKHDRQPPPMRSRTPETIAAMLATPYCEICGARFGSKRTSRKSGKTYRFDIITLSITQ